jgi:hypothetical protein
MPSKSTQKAKASKIAEKEQASKIKKAKPSKLDSRFLRVFDSRVESTLEEVRNFLEHPRLDLIPAKEWLYDADIGIPTIDILVYIAVEMLNGERRALYFMAASCLGVDIALATFVNKTRKLDALSLKHSVKQALARMTFVEWLCGGKDQAHWAICQWGFDNKHETPEHRGGARRIAQAMIEAFTARAVFLKDWKDIAALSLMIKAEATGERRKGNVVTEIALQIFTWYPYLAAKLDRAPTREEIRRFVTEVQVGVSERKEAWCDAQRLLRYEYAAPRSIRKDEYQIAKLVLEARETGPQCPEKQQTRKVSEVGLEDPKAQPISRFRKFRFDITKPDHI